MTIKFEEVIINVFEKYSLNSSILFLSAYNLETGFYE